MAIYTLSGSNRGRILLRDLKIIAFLIVFVLGTPPLFLTASEPDYREHIELMVNVYPQEMICKTIVGFSFNELNYPPILNDFTVEPGFLGLNIVVHYFSGSGSTLVSIFLNDSEIIRNQGRLIADMLAYRLERAFGIHPLSYTESNGTIYSPGRIQFSYFTEFPAIVLRKIFLESLPLQGFRQILTSSQLDSCNHSIYVSMDEEGGLHIEVRLLDLTTKMILGKEQTISLKEITGYLGSIDLSHTTFSSALRIRVTFNMFGDYKLFINKVLPAQMPENRETHGAIIEHEFHYDVTGSSFEDLSISLTIAQPLNLISVAIILTQITIIVCTIIIVKRHKR